MIMYSLVIIYVDSFTGLQVIQTLRYFFALYFITTDQCQNCQIRPCQKIETYLF